MEAPAYARRLPDAGPVGGGNLEKLFFNPAVRAHPFILLLPDSVQFHDFRDAWPVQCLLQQGFAFLFEFARF